MRWQAWLAGIVALAVFCGGRHASAQKSSQEIVVPAVSFVAQDGGEAVKRTSGTFGPDCIHFWCTPGHWLEWTFAGADAGSYQVKVRYAGKHPAQRSVEVNGEPVEELKSVVLPATGRWSDWSEYTLPAAVTLRPGTNTIRMTCLDSVSVRLASVSLVDRSGRQRTVKAREFSAENGGRCQILVPAARGTVTGIQKPGHWLEWTVEAPAPGRYQVELHYMSDGYVRQKLEVNGKPVEGLADYILPYTGDESHWALGVLPVPVRLSSGTNTLRLTVLAGTRKEVPTVDGVMGLSAMRFSLLREGQPPSGNILALIAEGELRGRDRPQPTPVAQTGPALVAPVNAIDLKEKAEFMLGRQKVTVAKADVLPYVKNTFSDRHVFENRDNPRLVAFREKYQLDKVVAPGRDEFEQQLLLMKWVYDQWDFGHGRELYNLRDPWWIMEEAAKEHKFQCMHSMYTLATAANSLGWVTRLIAIPQHSINEIWSNQYRKWILFDATSNYVPEKNGVPLNIYEMRQALLKEGGGVMRVRMGSSGRESSPQSVSYGQRLLFIGYVPNSNVLDAGPDWGKMYVTKDELCEGKSWHTRDNPRNPGVDPYFPVNQAAVALSPADAESVSVSLGTLTPNFKEFQARIDGGQWQKTETVFVWKLHPGENTLEAKSVNLFGREGPVSTVVLKW